MGSDDVNLLLQLTLEDLYSYPDELLPLGGEKSDANIHPQNSEALS